MGREYVTVTLTARVSGDFVIVLDAHGKKIAKIKHDSAGHTSKQKIALLELRHEWRLAFARMMGQFNGVRARHEETPWQKNAAHGSPRCGFEKIKTLR